MIYFICRTGLLSLMIIVVIAGFSATAAQAPEIRASSIMGRAVWADPQTNFIKTVNPISLGDINGDGLVDMAMTYLGVADERTADLSDITTKSLVYFSQKSDVDAHDQLLYGTLFPVGDLNNDGRSDVILDNGSSREIWTGSSSGFVATGLSFPSLPPQRYLGFVDLDGNGYGDVVIFTTSIVIHLNPMAPEGGTVITTSLNSMISQDLALGLEATAWRPKDSSHDELVLFLRNNNVYYEIVRTNVSPDKTSLQKLHTYRVSYYDGWIPYAAIGTTSLTPRLLPKMGPFVSAWQDEIAFFTPTSTHILRLNPNPRSSVTTVVESDFYPSIDQALIPTDDVNNDGRIDFIDPQTRSVITIDSVDHSFKTVRSLGIDGALPGLEMNPPTFISWSSNPISMFGSVRTSSNPVSVALMTSRSGRTQAAVFTDAEGSWVMRSELYDRNPIRRIMMTANAGDLNKDGIPDYSLLTATDNGRRAVEIYFGGTIRDSNPDLILKADSADAYTPSFGDVNGDGWIDILVPYIGVSAGTSGAYLYLGRADRSALPDHSWTMQTLVPEATTTSRVVSAAFVGDLDADGFDDIAIHMKNASVNTFVFYGGPTVNVMPDVILPHAGASMHAAGDVSGDGVDDLVLGDDDYFTEEFGIRTSGRLSVYYGARANRWSESGPGAPNVTKSISFDISDVTLNAPSFFGTNITTGQFFGDLTRDIITSPYLFQRLVGDRGNEFLYMMEGGDLLRPGFRFASTIPSGLLSVNPTSPFVRSIVGDLVTIPDANGDGWDELLLTSGGGRRSVSNALLFLSDAASGRPAILNPPIVLKSENPGYALGSHQLLFGNYNNHSAVGDFNNDGKVEILLSQHLDVNYTSDPLYVFLLEDALATSIERTESPHSVSLSQNYPNPFNPSTKVRVHLPSDANIRLTVWNVLGQRVATIAEGWMSAGTHQVRIDGSDWASGMYLIRLDVDGTQLVRRMMLVK
jgi:hypothetical protein